MAQYVYGLFPALETPACHRDCTQAPASEYAYSEALTYAIHPLANLYLRNAQSSISLGLLDAMVDPLSFL